MARLAAASSRNWDASRVESRRVADACGSALREPVVSESYLTREVRRRVKEEMAVRPIRTDGTYLGVDEAIAWGKSLCLQQDSSGAPRPVVRRLSLYELKRSMQYSYVGHCSRNFNILATSLFLAPRSPVRLLAMRLVDSAVYQGVVLLVILLNTLALAIQMADPDTTNTPAEHLDTVCTIFFLVEMLVAVVAHGLVMHRSAYMRDPWNIIDFFVVLTGVLELLVPFADLGSLRLLRILRPLRTVKRVKGMALVFETLVAAIPRMLDAFFLLFFFIWVCAVLGLQLWRGQAHNRCYEVHNTTYVLAGESGRACSTNGMGRRCPEPLECHAIEQQHHTSHLNFDNLFNALLLVFKAVSLDDWHDDLLRVHDISGWGAWAFFFICTMLGGYLCVTLVTAILLNEIATPPQLPATGREIPGLTPASVMAAALHPSMALAGVPVVLHDVYKHTADVEALEEDAELEVLDGVTDADEVVRVQEAVCGLYHGAKEAANQRQIRETMQKSLEGLKRATGEVGKSSGREESLIAMAVDTCLAKLREAATAAEVKGIIDQGGMRGRVVLVIQHPASRAAMLVITLLNLVVLACDHYGIDDEMSSALDGINLACTVAFLVEMVVKLGALGPRLYYADQYNTVDFVLCILAIPELAADSSRGSALSAFRVLRVVRTARLIRVANSWGGLSSLLTAIVESLTSVLGLAVIMALMVFVFAVLGMQLFWDRETKGLLLDTRSSFASLPESLLTVFVVVTGEAWSETMARAMDTHGRWACCYFVAVVLLGNYVVANLFVAILVENFVRASPAREKSTPLHLRNGCDAEAVLSQTTKDVGHDSTSAPGSSRNRSSSSSASSPHAESSCAASSGGGSSVVVVVVGGSDNGEGGQTPREDIHEPIAEDEVIDCYEGAESPQGVYNKLLTVLAGPPPCPPPMSPDSSSASSSSAQEKSALAQYAQQMRATERAHLRRRHDDRVIMQLRINGGADGPSKYASAGAGSDVPVLTGTSLHLFRPTNPLRIALYTFTQWRHFETLVSVTIALSCINIALDSPARRDSSGGWAHALDALDVFFTVVFCLEVLVKVIANGLWWNDGAYLRSVWNRMDLVVVLCGVVGTAFNQSNLLLKEFRSLRVVRLILKLKNSRVALMALLKAIPQMVHVVLIMLVVWIVFAVVGVQLFKGRYSYCTDPLVLKKEHCVGNANGTVRAWVGEEDYSFAHVGVALFTLWEVALNDGWADIMYRGVDSPDASDEAVVPHSARNIGKAAVYFVVFVLVAQFCLLNLFVGVLLDEFNTIRQRDMGVDQLSPGEKAWVVGVKTVLKYPIEEAASPPESKWRMTFFRMARSRWFEPVVIGLIVLNAISMSTAHHGMSSSHAMALEVLNILFAALFTCEAMVKVLGFGAVQYLKSGWNRFDAFLVITSWLGVVLINTSSSAFRVFRVGRLLRLANFSRHLEMLFSTLVTALPSILNIGVVLLALFFVFASFGVSAFGRLAKSYNGTNDYLNEYRNFDNMGTACITLWQMATGQGWADIMRGCMVQPPECSRDDDGGPGSDCGTQFARVYFALFTVVMLLVSLSLLVCVIIHHFTDMVEGMQYRGRLEVFKMVRRRWAAIDPSGTTRADAGQVVTLIRSLPPPLFAPPRVGPVCTSCHNRKCTTFSHTLTQLNSMHITLASRSEVEYNVLVSNLLRRVFNVSNAMAFRVTTALGNEMKVGYHATDFTLAHNYAVQRIVAEWKRHRDEASARASRLRAAKAQQCYAKWAVKEERARKEAEAAMARRCAQQDDVVRQVGNLLNQEEIKRKLLGDPVAVEECKGCQESTSTEEEEAMVVVVDPLPHRDSQSSSSWGTPTDSHPTSPRQPLPAARPFRHPHHPSGSHEDRPKHPPTSNTSPPRSSVPHSRPPSLGPYSRPPSLGAHSRPPSLGPHSRPPSLGALSNSHHVPARHTPQQRTPTMPRPVSIPSQPPSAPHTIPRAASFPCPAPLEDTASRTAPSQGPSHGASPSRLVTDPEPPRRSSVAHPMPHRPSPRAPEVRSPANCAPLLSSPGTAWAALTAPYGCAVVESAYPSSTSSDVVSLHVAGVNCPAAPECEAVVNPLRLLLDSPTAAWSHRGEGDQDQDKARKSVEEDEADVVLPRSPSTDVPEINSRRQGRLSAFLQLQEKREEEKRWEEAALRVAEWASLTSLPDEPEPQSPEGRAGVRRPPPRPKPPSRQIAPQRFPPKQPRGRSRRVG
eukprot:Sspe_Gene.45228::Locus_22352_Transcript_1_1_Confidence_1.000_Length_6852::g.45228::m.45228